MTWDAFGRTFIAIPYPKWAEIVETFRNPDPEIGGNQILVKTGKAAFWLDMGPPGLYEFNFFERQMFRSRTAEELGKRMLFKLMRKEI